MPSLTFMNAGMAAHTAPATKAATSVAEVRNHPGALPQLRPTQAAAIAPA